MTHIVVLYALIATLGTWSVTALGAATVIFFRKQNQGALNLMLGFAAGVMIAASFWSLLQPAIERAAETSKLPPYVVVTVGFLSGAAFLWLLGTKLGHPHAAAAENRQEAWGIA